MNFVNLVNNVIFMSLVNVRTFMKFGEYCDFHEFREISEFGECCEFDECCDILRSLANVALRLVHFARSQMI